MADFAAAGSIVQFGSAPNRIDILTEPAGLPPFAVAWERRAEFEVEGQRWPVLSHADLVASKRAAGRRKDLADLEALGEL